MRYLLFLLLLYPFLEIATLVWLSTLIGGWVLVIVILSSMLGAWMLRNRQLGTLFAFWTAARSSGETSIYQVLWPLRYILAGVLFFIPGILSDVLAIVLLLPFKGPTINSPPATENSTNSPDIIEGEYLRVDDKDRLDGGA